MKKMLQVENENVLIERKSLLSKLENFLEVPMLFLSFTWLILMICEFTVGLSTFFIYVNNFIWGLFVIDFLIKIILAPQKIEYLKKNWITTLALILPAFRLFRILRTIRLLRLSGTLRTLRLARVLTSLNRGVTALGNSLSRRGLGYVLGLTLIVMFAGAAGILSFEKEIGGIQDYGTAVWWTAMTLTTMGSDYFPKTSEGRLLCLILAIYGFAIFGYITATVATYFVGRDAENANGEIAGQKAIDELKLEIIELKKLVEENLRLNRS